MRFSVSLRLSARAMVGFEFFLTIITTFSSLLDEKNVYKVKFICRLGLLLCLWLAAHLSTNYPSPFRPLTVSLSADCRSVCLSVCIPTLVFSTSADCRLPVTLSVAVSTADCPSMCPSVCLSSIDFLNIRQLHVAVSSVSTHSDTDDQAWSTARAQNWRSATTV